MSRPRGTGRLYQQKEGGNWYLKYYKNGIPIRECSATKDRKKAEKILQRRIGEVATGTFIGLKFEKIRVLELAEDLIREYRINGRKSIDDLQARWDLHLKPFFGTYRAVEVSSSLVGQYVDKRQQEGAQNATINRELAALKRMFNLGKESSPPKVREVPYFAMLKEDNVRTGFLEMSQHDRLAAECAKVGLWLRAAFEVGYTFGWRHEEVLRMRVSQVDLMAGTIRLEPGTTKNMQGREVTMTKPVRDLLTQCVIGKNADDYVFTRTKGKLAKQKPVRVFRKSWVKVCEAAGVPDLLFHDLRRSAARNLRKAGVPEGVIMKIGGWKTRSVFDRYAIVAQSDISAAMQVLEVQQQKETAKAAEEKEKEIQFGHKTGINEDNRPDVTGRTHLPN